MENLAEALEGKKLEDLKGTDPTTGSNLIEPTKEEIESILTALKEGKSYSEIKKTIRRDEDGGKKGFSFGQIKQIDLARKEKIAELIPAPEVAEI